MLALVKFLFYSENICNALSTSNKTEFLIKFTFKGMVAPMHSAIAQLSYRNVSIYLLEFILNSFVHYKSTKNPFLGKIRNQCVNIILRYH